MASAPTGNTSGEATVPRGNTWLEAMRHHTPVELARVLAQAHELHELVLHEQGALVANAEVAHELERRDIVLALGQQVHGQEPARERQLGRLEDRTADEGALMTVL